VRYDVEANHGVCLMYSQLCDCSRIARNRQSKFWRQSKARRVHASLVAAGTGKQKTSGAAQQIDSNKKAVVEFMREATAAGRRVSLEVQICKRRTLAQYTQQDTCMLPSMYCSHCCSPPPDWQCCPWLQQPLHIPLSGCLCCPLSF
jgi:hypothetical protein